MISFIVDGFDPWDKVYAILRSIHDAEILDEYEVILMASLLLDTPQKRCESAGSDLFGNCFRFINNDSLSVVEARCRAQELAHGDKFFYISPSVLPEKHTISKLLTSLDCHRELIFAGSPLTFSYNNVGEERLLAHGYAVAPAQKITPFLLTMPKYDLASERDYPVRFVAPYCFCSRGPFYTHKDQGQNSFWRHMGACVRQGGEDIKGLSVGQAPAHLYDEAFVSYYRSWCSESKLENFVNSIDLERLANTAQGDLELTPYGEFRVKSPSAYWPLPRHGDTDEQIFWSLLYWGRPEFIAAASHGCPDRALRELAQICIWKISCTSWKYISQYIMAQRSVVPAQNQAILHAYSDWLTTYTPQANEIYAQDDISLLSSFVHSKDVFTSIKNYLFILRSGLFALKR